MSAPTQHICLLTEISPNPYLALSLFLNEAATEESSTKPAFGHLAPSLGKLQTDHAKTALLPHLYNHLGDGAEWTQPSP